mmetsp:Transcript_41536/g.45085  ORF Transcript_41536/g.45085 Transcript_41536/m.45085 type:complete len:117 (+) Transcript_41536:171-521(+)
MIIDHYHVIETVSSDKEKALPPDNSVDLVTVTLTVEHPEDVDSIANSDGNRVEVITIATTVMMPMVPTIPTMPTTKAATRIMMLTPMMTPLMTLMTQFPHCCCCWCVSQDTTILVL